MCGIWSKSFCFLTDTVLTVCLYAGKEKTCERMLTGLLLIGIYGFFFLAVVFLVHDDKQAEESCDDCNANRGTNEVE